MRERLATQLDVLCLSTQGTGSNDEQRILDLLGLLDPEAVPFDRSRKAASLFRCVAELLRRRPDVVVLEGTGLAGGLAVLTARLGGVPYVVSSGDAVAPYLASRRAVLWPLGLLYEAVLCAASSGFIAWTPYLAGRALTLGADRVATAPGWSPADRPADAAAARRRFGIAPDALVLGIVGSLSWTPRRQYCYGLEIVRAVRRSSRPDVVGLVVGDGDGLERLREEAAGDPRIVLPGRVPRSDVPEALAAMDVASLPQSVDGVGSYRYTTKLSEYLTAGLPVVTGQIPAAYDLDTGWLWRLEGESPWDPRYVAALTRLLDGMGPDELDERRRAVPVGDLMFDRSVQRTRMAAFVADCADRARSGRGRSLG